MRGSPLEVAPKRLMFGISDVSGRVRPVVVTDEGVGDARAGGAEFVNGGAGEDMYVAEHHRLIARIALARAARRIAGRGIAEERRQSREGVEDAVTEE